MKMMSVNRSPATGSRVSAIARAVGEQRAELQAADVAGVCAGSRGAGRVLEIALVWRDGDGASQALRKFWRSAATCRRS